MFLPATGIAIPLQHLYARRWLAGCGHASGVLRRAGRRRAGPRWTDVDEEADPSRRPGLRGGCRPHTWVPDLDRLVDPAANRIQRPTRPFWMFRNGLRHGSAKRARLTLLSGLRLPIAPPDVAIFLFLSPGTHRLSAIRHHGSAAPVVLPGVEIANQPKPLHRPPSALAPIAHPSNPATTS
jgi:hypothetical protein